METLPFGSLRDANYIIMNYLTDFGAAAPADGLFVDSDDSTGLT